MTRSQRRVLFIGFCVIALMWAFPPWIHYSNDPKVRAYIGKPRGYFFVFDTHQGENLGGLGVFQIDLWRAIAQTAMASAITAAIFFALKPPAR